MASSSYPVYQCVMVALLAAFGLVTIGRWLRTTEYQAWTWGWSVLAIGNAFLCLAPVFPHAGDQLFLLIHTFTVACFCVLAAYGTTLATKLEDIRYYRVTRANLSLLVLLTILTILIAVWRWPASQRHSLWDERFIWNGPWLLAYALLNIWIITRYQTRWYMRKVNLLFVYALSFLAGIEALVMGILLTSHPPLPLAGREVLNILMQAEPIVLLVVALVMHMLMLDGLAHHLEKTLVQVSKNSAKLKLMAERDPLTAVLNRHAFYSMVGSARDESKRPLGGSVAVLDIDSLKPLNDKYGHQVGDAVIRAVAKAIRSVIRAEDLLFRWGGDEFMVILPHVDLEESRWRFEKLDDVLKKTPLPGVPEPMDITLSVGVSPFSTSNTLEKAIEEADERMYARKAEKKETPTPSI